METKTKMDYKYAPITDWAQIKAVFACLIALLGTFLCPADALAAQDNELMARLYRQYLAMPTQQLYQKGVGFLEEEKYDEAMVCFTIIGNRDTTDMDSDERNSCARALNNAGAIAQLRNSYSTAFSYFKKAMQVAKEPIYQTYNNIAGIYLYYNDYPNAKRYLQDAFDISMQQQDWSALSKALLNIMMLNWRADSVERAVPFIDRYLQAPDVPRDSIFFSTSTMAQGMKALAQGDMDSAVKTLRQSALSPDLQTTALVYLAGIYMQKHDYQQALRYLEKGEASLRREESVYLLMQALQMEAECYEQTGNQQALHETRYAYMTLKDSLNTAEEMGRIKNIEFFHEVQGFEQQMVRLNEEKHARSIIAAVCFAALVIVIAVMIVLVMQRRQLRQSNKELYVKNEELLRQAEELRQRRRQNPAPSSLLPSPSSQNYSPSSPAPPLLERIYELLDDTEFLAQQNLTVDRLAEALGVHEKTVSSVINEATGKNFNTLLNEYRIREVCKRLTDFEHYGMMNTETIAENMGYKSRSHFIRTFKKVTGLTPLQYQKLARDSASNT